MWLNVQFRDEFDQLIEEYGAYNAVTAELDGSDTTVFEAKHGMDSVVAAATNLPEGPSFHLALNNVINFDNRIPAIGFTNAAWEAFGSPPVGVVYEDGQYWHETEFAVPSGAESVVVALNFQPMTKEYIEFLRDGAPVEGQAVYDLWDDPLIGNRVPPVDMDMVGIDLHGFRAGDFSESGTVDFNDLLLLFGFWGACPPPDICRGDLNGDGIVDFNDLLALFGEWG